MLTLELDGVDPLDLDDTDVEGIVVEQFDLGFPEVRGVVANRPGRDGVDDQTAFLGARVVSVTGVVVAAGSLTRDGVLRRLRRFCHPATRPLLRFTLDGTTYRIRLRSDAHSAPFTIPGAANIAVTWRSVTAHYEADIESAVTLFPEVPTEGRTYDLAFDRTYPPAAGSSLITATNNGDVAADPVITLYGPLTDPTIENLTTGEALTFDGLTVNAGEYLVIDMAAPSVLLDGDPGASRFETVAFAESRWWQLAPGPNEIRFAADTWSSPAQAVVTWRDAYL